MTSRFIYISKAEQEIAFSTTNLSKLSSACFSSEPTEPPQPPTVLSNNTLTLHESGGTDYAHHITFAPPRFLDYGPVAALQIELYTNIRHIELGVLLGGVNQDLYDMVLVTDYGHPIKLFFIKNPKLLGLGRQIWQINFGAFVSPFSMFSINQPLFLQKTNPLYPNAKYLFGIGI